MKIPDWWGAILLALAAWRTFQLIARDDILDGPRRRILRLGKTWKKEGDAVPKDYRAKLGLFIECPYCAGFWITIVWWAAWQISDKWTIVVAAPFALHAGLVAADKLLGSE